MTTTGFRTTAWAALGAAALALATLAPAAGHDGPDAKKTDARKERQKQQLEAAVAYAKAVAGNDNSPQFLTLFDHAIAGARLARPGGQRMHGPGAHAAPGGAEATSPFARARARVGAEAAARASIKNDPTWQANQLKLIQLALEEDPGNIYGGVEAEEGEFPHCVAVGAENDFCCTGTLVGPNVVVTAAHCVKGGCASRVYFGLNANAPDSKRVVAVAKAVAHEGYNDFTSGDDIAILVLKENAPATARPCPIAETADVDAAFYLRLAGFGLTENNSHGVMRKVDVAVASSSCGDAAAMAKYRCHSGKELVAGGNGYDSCNGDSGGPAYVVKKKKLLYLAGATSRATANSQRACGDGGVYVRVDKYKEWIVKTATAHGGVVGEGKKDTK